MLLAAGIEEVLESGRKTYVEPFVSYRPCRRGEGMDLKSAAHVCRVVNQLGAARRFYGVYALIAAARTPSGGWGPWAAESARVGITAFVTNVMASSGLAMFDGRIREAVRAGTRFLLGAQAPDGRWREAAGPLRASAPQEERVAVLRGDVDVTCAVVHAIRRGASWAPELRRMIEESFRRGMEWLVSTQAPDGGWVEEGKDRSRVGATADAVRALALRRAANEGRMARAAGFLVERQEEDGSWDDGDVDHTCDAVRGIVTVLGGTPSACERAIFREAADRAVQWILDARNPDGGWGRRRGDASNPNEMGDVLSTLIENRSLRGR